MLAALINRFFAYILFERAAGTVIRVFILEMMYFENLLLFLHLNEYNIASFL